MADEEKKIRDLILEKFGYIIPPESDIVKFIEHEKTVGQHLPMDLESRLARAKKMGFDVDNPQYHGTAKGGFNYFDPDLAKHGLYGKGFYFTDDPSIASEYTEKGVKKILQKKETPTQMVYPTFLKVKNPLIMEAPADLKSWKKILKKHGVDHVLEQINSSKLPTNHDVYRLLENEYQDASNLGDLSRYEAEEKLQEILRGKGHDSIQHQGGNIIGEKKHNVTVVFDPEQIRSKNAKFDPIYEQAPDILSFKKNKKLKFPSIGKTLGVAGTISDISDIVHGNIVEGALGLGSLVAGRASPYLGALRPEKTVSEEQEMRQLEENKELKEKEEEAKYRREALKRLMSSQEE